MFEAFLPLAVVLLLQLVPAFRAVSAPSQEPPSIQWRSYKEGRQEAREKRRPIFLFVHSQVSAWCMHQVRVSHENPHNVQLINTRFIPIYIDFNKDLSLINALQVNSIPTTNIAAPDGTVLHVHEGHMSAESLTREIRKVLDKADH